MSFVPSRLQIFEQRQPEVEKATEGGQCRLHKDLGQYPFGNVLDLAARIRVPARESQQLNQMCLNVR